MINDKLREFIEIAIDRQYISADDVEILRRDVLADGIVHRREAEALLALDRTVKADEAWRPVLTALVVDFVSGCLRRSETVPGGDTIWLATALDVSGPTETAMNIAYAILSEIRHVDAALLDFIMRGRQQARLGQLAA